MIESNLENKNVPARVFPFLNKLWFKTALLTGDMNRISNSAQAVVEELCEVNAVDNYQDILELARIANKIREKYPQQSEELLRPLIAQMVKHVGSDIKHNLEKFMRTIESNKWFWYGRMLVEEACNQALIEEDVENTLITKLKVASLAKEKLPTNHIESSTTVKEYMAQLSAYPPTGTLTMDDIREIMKEGLEKSCKDANIERKDELVEDTVDLIRMIAGEGPFRGNKDKLINSIRRFSRHYLVVFKYQEPIDTALATFLALSFCDNSTEEDHDVLFSQIDKLCTEFQSLTNSMLAERELQKVVTPIDVERLFTKYKKKFRIYIDDPLWPSFKFPLTDNEQARLRNKLKQRFDRLEPVLDDASLKAKYGGISDELRDTTKYETASAILQLLPQAAFLRNPPYPGISCRHKGTYGFAAVIKGPFYIEGERPREKFKAMKYFHMGHRLEDIVKRERELSGFK
jgi:hypothetical protein